MCEESRGVLAFMVPKLGDFVILSACIVSTCHFICMSFWLGQGTCFFCFLTVTGHNVSKSALRVAPRAHHFLFFGTKALHSSQQNHIIACPPFLVSSVAHLHSSLLFIHPCFLGTHLTPPHHNCGFPLCINSHKSCQSVAPEQAIKPTDHQSSHLPLVFIHAPMM